MGLIRTSAVIALLYGLLGVAVFFVPLFYHLPLQLYFDVGDTIPAITNVAFFVGAFFALRRADPSILIAAWSWALALHASALVHTILLTKDSHSRTASPFFTMARQADLHIGMVHLAVVVIGFTTVMLGYQLIRRNAQRA